MIKTLRNTVQSFLYKYWMIIAIIAAFVILRIVTAQPDAIASWDGSVYVGMGKYLYSNGTIGTWEALRPIGLPVILGGFWKLGIDPYLAGSVIGFLGSIGLIVIVYAFAERLRPRSGAIAAALLAGTAVFFANSALPITDILSTTLAVCGVYVAYRAKGNRNYFFAGLVIALAFMFRFPQGLALAVSGIIIFIKALYEKGKWPDRIERMIEHVFALAGGFFLIVVPYLVGNHLAYGNAFLPFIEGVAVIKQYPSLYQKGPWFYAIEVFKQNPLYVLALVPIGLSWQKKQRSLELAVVLTGLVIVSAYFTHEVHKETRYMMPFLPYIVLLTAAAVTYLLERFRLPQFLFFALFIIAGFMLNAGMLIHPPRNPDNMVMHGFASHLRTAPQARVLTTTPALFAYTDVRLVRNLYSDWNDAYKAYIALKSETDYMVFSSCNLETGCADNLHCKNDKQALLDTLAKSDTLVFSETTPSQCVLSIYKLNH